MIECWRLDSPATSLVLVSHNGRLPEVLHFGARLADGENLVALYRAAISDVTGGMIDARPLMSVCPLREDVFPGAQGTDADFQPRFVSAEEEPNSLSLTFADGQAQYRLDVTLDAETDVWSLTAHLSGVEANWLTAPAFPVPSDSDHFVTYSGKWIGEFQENRVDWVTGAHVREVRDGRTSHEAFPGVLIPCDDGFIAAHLGMSCGHRFVAEQLPDGRRQVQFGPMLGRTETEITAGPLYLTRAQNRNGVTANLHAHFRRHIRALADPERPRPVHYNCWEAVYFDHDEVLLRDIAIRAAALGAERFVLDDGWFGLRDDDTTSLGDWQIDPRKWPDGFSAFIEHVNTLGMTFGIWFEPEMINPVSKLYETHPDWILGEADQPLGRQQLVLDMTKPEVIEYLFEQIDAVLSNYKIDYIKWDHNRVLPFPDHRQVRATYALMDRIRAAHPGVEIETCASGGGRIDWGMLSRTSRVWLSDSNDALERMRIQAMAAPWLPPEITGSHVGPRQCHTSHRILPMELRAWVAAQRSFGFEMNLLELSPEESDTLSRVSTWWKANRDWMHSGSHHKLSTRDPEQFAEMIVSADKTRFAVWLGQRGAPADILPDRLRFDGLENRPYRVRRISHFDGGWLSRGDNALKDENGVQLYGQSLMSFGLQPPVLTPASILVLEGEAA
ncbi:alpha-galactosidase [Pontivivens insulae]|uniref:alpha-galactosidase n=1 Tax=Pontivivens insulae TaxID=1639689 RepID=A0A2R8AE03_9RHOB|nr:alpha-galactosidase [Pontivivens insulae]RED14387.1 alpha-galactosidase [Pontivivens insulae]SPF30464.1 Alpha-galactosidase [Pontivivens insulae]